MTQLRLALAVLFVATVVACGPAAPSAGTSPTASASASAGPTKGGVLRIGYGAEVDMFWEKLSEGGSKGPCGWLTDRFGVSWQIVPRVLSKLLNDPDKAKASRVMKAMLQMSKIEIAELERAAEGGTVEATSGR